MKILYFIVEGYSEELFLNNALIPYLKNKGKNFIHACQNLSGGIHLPKLVSIITDNINKYDYVTTFIDLARLHTAKFNNYNNIMAQNIHSSQKATTLEQQLEQSLGLSPQIKHKFIPHIQPYEFEALCFADADSFNYDPKIKKNIAQIKKIANSFSDSESINNQNLPNARLIKYGYIKQSSIFSKYCNVDNIRKSCPHFNQWLNNLENII